MPKVSGVFEKFDNLDQLSIEEVSHSLKPQPPFFLENFIGNKILYPQTLPTSPQDLEIELAVLREAIKLQSEYYLTKDKQIIIPEDLINRFPNIATLAWVFVDALRPQGIVRFIHPDREILGTFIKIDFAEVGDFEFMVEEKRFKLKRGNIITIPCSRHCHINFKSGVAKIDGKSESTLEITGGILGLILDGRTV